MPAGFDWVSIDIHDPNQLEEVYTLLTENYVEDDDNMFRYVTLLWNCYIITVFAMFRLDLTIPKSF